MGTDRVRSLPPGYARAALAADDGSAEAWLLGIALFKRAYYGKARDVVEHSVALNPWPHCTAHDTLTARRPESSPWRERLCSRPLATSALRLPHRAIERWHERRRVRLPQVRDLFGEDSWRNVYAGELEVRPPGAPTTHASGRPSKMSTGLGLASRNRKNATGHSSATGGLPNDRCVEDALVTTLAD
jgi:hypothetical protein